MKKITLPITFFLLLTTTQAVFADLKQAPSLKILGSSKLKSVKSVVPQEEAVLINKKKVEAKVNTMRCWQNGELILAENNWLNAIGTSPVLINNNQEKMYAFDYGETFCMYLGD